MSATAAMIAALMEEETTEGGNAAGTPLDYQDLLMFLDAENDTIGSGSDVTTWEDQSSNSFDFTVPASSRNPILIANAQNGLPGVEFDEAPSGSNPLARRLSNNSGSFTNYFSGSGDKSIGFAARFTQFNSGGRDHTLISKGFYGNFGWRLSLQQSGNFLFQHRRNNGSTFSILAAGFYGLGDLVMGSLTWDGANSSGGITLRLFNGTDFVETGSVTLGSSAVIGNEAADDLMIGNVLDRSDGSRFEPWGGQIMGIWMVKPGSTTFDVSYQNRWIVV